MDSILESVRFPVATVGCLAARILDRNVEGRALAVFRSSFYIEAPDGLICIGHEAIGDSPLTIVAAAPRNIDWVASGIHRGARVVISARTIRVGGRLLFDCGRASVWAPAPSPRNWRIEGLEKGLAAFREACDGRIPREGLGGFIRRPDEPAGDATPCNAAVAPVAGMRSWLASSLLNTANGTESEPHWVRNLLGMGPGLTPSGDDFVAGTMIALRSMGEHDLCRLLWEAARPFADDAGNRIALAHLEAAAKGFASPGVHSAIAGLLAADRNLIGEAMDSIDEIGHTSGWDAMAGIVQTCDVWLQVRTSYLAHSYPITAGSA